MERAQVGRMDLNVIYSSAISARRFGGKGMQPLLFHSP